MQYQSSHQSSEYQSSHQSSRQSSHQSLVSPYTRSANYSHAPASVTHQSNRLLLRYPAVARTKRHALRFRSPGAVRFAFVPVLHQRLDRRQPLRAVHLDGFQNRSAPGEQVELRVLQGGHVQPLRRVNESVRPVRGNREAGIRETREAVPGESDLNSANVSPPPKNLYALLLWEIAESSASVPCDGEKKVSVLYGQQSCTGREKSLRRTSMGDGTRPFAGGVWANRQAGFGCGKHVPSWNPLLVSPITAFTKIVFALDTAVFVKQKRQS